MKHFCGKFVKYREKIMIALLFLLIITIAVIWASQKSGMYIDEGMTLYLSNGNYNGAVTTDSDYTLFDFVGEYVWKGSISATFSNVMGMIRQLTGGGNYSIQGSVDWYDEARGLLQGSYAWMSGEELLGQIAVTKGDGFQYGQVLVNQAMDVHPPFYYLLVHTIFSLFRNSCTKWHLFAVNLMFLMGSLALIYRLVRKYFGGFAPALLTAALFGFSQGFMSCAVYFRMYAVFTFFVIAAYGVQLYLMEHDFALDKRDRILLVLSTVLGFYTHYYFILFLAGIVLLNVFFFVRDKRFSCLLKYIKTMVIAGLISLVIWPFSIYHILFGYRGTEAVSKLTASGFMKNAGDYIKVVSKAFFGKSIVLAGIMAAALAVLAGAAVWGARKQKECDVIKSRKWLFALFPSLFYSLFMIQITPVREDRYLMCVFPFLAMVIAWGILTISSGFKDKVLQRICCMVLSIGLVLLNLRTVPNYLYLEQRGKKAAETERNCIMLLLDDAYGYEQVMDLTEYPQVLVLTYTDVEVLSKLVPDDPQKGFVIYIHKVLEEEELLKEACEALSAAIGKELKADEAVEVESKYQYMRAFVITTAI